MTQDPPDIDALARRFMDLWRDQMQASMADPATAQAFGRAAEAWAPMMQLWSGALGGAFPVPPAQGGTDAPSGPPRDADEPQPARPRTRASRAAGAEATGAALSDRDEFLHELDRRLRGLEERIAALESGPGGTRPRAGKRSSGRTG